MDRGGITGKRKASESHEGRKKQQEKKPVLDRHLEGLFPRYFDSCQGTWELIRDVRTKKRGNRNERKIFSDSSASKEDKSRVPGTERKGGKGAHYGFKGAVLDANGHGSMVEQHPRMAKI